MERDFRFRVSGVIFFLIGLLHLAFTDKGKCFILNLTNEPDTIQIIVAIISGVFLIFASDSMGFIFSTLFLFIFNIRDGYAGVYTRRIGNLKKTFMDIYNNSELQLPEDQSIKEFGERLNKYNTEHFLIYFLWHHPDGVNDNLNKWVERRHTAYFTSYSIITAATIASLLSSLIIYIYDLSFTTQNQIIFMVTAIIFAILIRNGERAMRDAIAITDLHIAGFINPRVKEIFGKNPPPAKFEFEKKEDVPLENSKAKKK
jgi:hypothetical protein